MASSSLGSVPFPLGEGYALQPEREDHRHLSARPLPSLSSPSFEQFPDRGSLTSIGSDATLKRLMLSSWRSPSPFLMSPPDWRGGFSLKISPPLTALLPRTPRSWTPDLANTLGRNLSFHSVNTRITNYWQSPHRWMFSPMTRSIVKVGEGTYGEAFLAGNTVCKIVPFHGDLRVNGEVQKKSEELLEEVVLSKTLNDLRELEGGSHNACTAFMETIDLKVRQGPYDQALIRAWEDWDEKNGSENDHPKGFPEKQLYVAFVLKHGGKDLESFVLNNFGEARSLLVQVTAGLSVAEAAFEFEHCYLHWYEELVSLAEMTMLKCNTLWKGSKSVKSHGLVISIIDFTLSRINTGDDILFLDLSSDPYLFKGPKGDKQAETYRKMKDITQDCWEGRNVVQRTKERLRPLKERLDKYESAKEAISDSFFSELLSD